MGRLLRIVMGVACVIVMSAREGRAAQEGVTDEAGVKRLVMRWATGPEEDRDGGEVAIQREIPYRLFPVLEAVSKGPELSESARAWLKEVIERERPWVEIRTRRGAVVDVELEWNGRNALESYDRAGKHDAKWDDAARKGIREFSTNRYSKVNAAAFLEQAVKAGCDDPLVMYMATRSQDIMHKGDMLQIEQRYLAATEGMLKSDYPAFRKEYTLLRCSSFLNKRMQDRIEGRENRPRPGGAIYDFRRLHEAALELWPAVAAEKGVPAIDLDELSTLMLECHWNLNVYGDPTFGGHMKEVFDKVYGPLAAALPGSAIPLALKGSFNIDWAWDARGSDWAANVTQEGWRLFGERLAKAHASLEAAWKIDPDTTEAARLMLTVAMGQQFPRDEMETWYDRAMQANPDNFNACRGKMLYLEPKWGGSTEAMLEFGRQCLAERNWAGNMPFAVVLAHTEVAAYAGDKDAYWKSADVWADLQGYYLPLVKGTEDPKVRSEYCHWACRTSHWDVAREQFKILGDDADPHAFGGRDKMEAMRAKANAAAETDAGQEKKPAPL